MAEKAKKAAAKKVAAPAVEAEATQRITFVMEEQKPTKGYAKFTPPADSGCVGTLYTPLGTKVVKVLIEGPA
jgi:hypothetical protein